MEIIFIDSTTEGQKFRIRNLSHMCDSFLRLSANETMLAMNINALGTDVRTP